MAAPFLCLRSGPGRAGPAAPVVAAGVADAEGAIRAVGARASGPASWSGYAPAVLATTLEAVPSTTTTQPVTASTVAPKPPLRPPAPRATAVRRAKSAADPAPVATTAVPTSAPHRGVTGTATWYDTADGRCAANVAPLGTVLTVTRRSTGASVTCRVVSRGPYGRRRVVDLARSTFARLAPPSVGVIEVVVSW